MNVEAKRIDGSLYSRRDDRYEKGTTLLDDGEGRCKLLTGLVIAGNLGYLLI